jgi:hypothetical protein
LEFWFANKPSGNPVALDAVSFSSDRFNLSLFQSVPEAGCRRNGTTLLLRKGGVQCRHPNYRHSKMSTNSLKCLTVHHHKCLEIARSKRWLID